MFEVGKKYRYNHNNRQGYSLARECLAVHKVAGGTWGFFAGEDGGSYIPTHSQWSTSWEEYKEPRSVTRWFNIWEKPDGSEVLFGSSGYKTEAEAKNADGGQWKRIDTLELKWIEKESNRA